MIVKGREGPLVKWATWLSTAFLHIVTIAKALKRHFLCYAFAFAYRLAQLVGEMRNLQELIKRKNLQFVLNSLCLYNYIAALTLQGRYDKSHPTISCYSTVQHHCVPSFQLQENTDKTQPFSINFLASQINILSIYQLNRAVFQG